MSRAFFCALAISSMMTGLSHAVEHVEIVLDASVAMSEPFQTGVPRIVAARKSLDAFIRSTFFQHLGAEIGLRTVGGRSEISGDPICDDADVLVARAPIDPALWQAVLSDIQPRGSRALVHAVEQAAASLAASEAERRIVVLTSGADQCHRDLLVLLDRLSQAERPVEVRIIGLGMDQKLADSLVLSTKTRNVNDPAKLVATLWWGVLPTKTYSPRKEFLELHLTRGGKPVTGATLHMENPDGGEEIVAPIDNGDARIRTALGIHWARVEGLDFGPIELAGIPHFGDRLGLTLVDAPPVTLEIDSDRPAAGDQAYVQYWGAPEGVNWIAITAAGAPADEFLVRTPAIGAAGEVSLRLPDSPNELEAQFSQDIGAGIYQILGHLSFDTARRRISIEAPERVENGTPLDLSWDGSELAGDHLSIAPKEGDPTDAVVCVAARGGGHITLPAPAISGNYVIHYLSQGGRSLARADLEVFEVLATLDAPGGVGPGDDFMVTWSGPEGAQDYLSIAAAGTTSDQYLQWAPTSAGNPARLTAPKQLGDYELRYVRGEDGEVLAKAPLTVAATRITLDVPPVVGAGTRFEVAWSGTAGSGDFIAVAEVGSGPRQHLDWAYTTLGSPLTLAAPFEPGKYVVRYVSGRSHEIIVRRPINVR